MRHLARITAVLFIAAMINFLAVSVPARAQTVTPGSTTHVATWVAPTTYADGTALTEPLTYNLYQLVAGAWVKVQSSVNALTASLSLAPGLQQVEVTAITADGRESARSAVASIVAVAPLPSAPTGVAIK